MYSIFDHTKNPENKNKNKKNALVDYLKLAGPTLPKKCPKESPCCNHKKIMYRFINFIY